MKEQGEERYEVSIEIDEWQCNYLYKINHKRSGDSSIKNYYNKQSYHIIVVVIAAINTLNYLLSSSLLMNGIGLAVSLHTKLLYTLLYSNKRYRNIEYIQQQQQLSHRKQLPIIIIRTNKWYRLGCTHIVSTGRVRGVQNVGGGVAVLNTVYQIGDKII